MRLLFHFNYDFREFWPKPDRIWIILAGTGPKPDCKLEKVDMIRYDWPDFNGFFNFEQ